MSRWWGRLARSTFIFAFVACVSSAAGRRQRTGRSGLGGAWCRPYWICRSTGPCHPRWRETCSMMVIGIDAHKRSHTAVSVDEMGRQGFVKTVGTTTQDHLRLLKWAVGFAEERLWAIEDCRHLTRRLERGLIAPGESGVRGSPKL